MQATATFFLLHAIDALDAALLALLYNQSIGVSATMQELQIIMLFYQK